MRRLVKKAIAGVCTLAALFVVTCSTAYADVPWEAERQPDAPVSMYIISLLVIAVVVATVLIIRKLWSKNK